ncbi:acylphosphatase [Oceanobacillus caeni]
MKNYKETWLPHLKGAFPEAAYGNPSCMYVMSLEGWRRGLELKFMIKKNTKNLLSAISYSLSDGKTEHVFHGSRGDFVTKEAIKICSNKDLTNKCLDEAGVSVPKGKGFNEETNEEILEYSNTLGYPLVLKPSGGEGGVGVITNIKNEEEMRKALHRIRTVASHKKVIVERFFVGEDFRVYVLDGKVIGAFHRRSQSVVGDGKLNLEELLEIKNKERQISPFLAKGTITMDKKMKEYLKERNLTPEYIPANGERVFLRRNGEFFGQRDSVNATGKLSRKMEELAISAVKAIPGLPHGGVDMLINLEKDEGVVNEVNSRAQISNHVFPVEGEAVDIPKLIIDYYFPETKGNDRNTSYYYEYKAVLESFENGTAEEIKIPSITIGTQFTKNYVIAGKNIEEKYNKRLQREARGLKVNGFVDSIDSENISVVASGTKKNIDSFEKKIKKHPFKNIKINNVAENDYNQPIKVGFEIK